MSGYHGKFFLLAPGFIACSTGFMLHDFPDKRDTLGVVMRYFTYSFFILPISLALAGVTGILPFWSTMETWDAMNAESLILLFAVVLFVSVIIGMSWPLIIRPAMLRQMNRINVKLGKNLVFLGARLFDEFFDDGRNHFIVVERDGKVQTMGMYAGASAPDAEKMELAVYAYPEYKEWFDRVQEQEEDHPLKHCKTVYMCPEDNIIIREYEYPAEWDG